MASGNRCLIRTRVDIPTFVACASILILAFQASRCQASKGFDTDLIIVKLDRILEIIGNLSTKYDHLEKIIIQRSKNYKHETEDPRQNHSTSMRSVPSDLKSKDSSLYEQAEDRSNRVEDSEESYRRDSKDGQVSAKDLFHFNKLAQSSNVIPSGSTPWSTKDEGNLNEWLVSSPSQYLQHEQRQMMSSIGQQYETMFGNALDNLNSVLKEQLAGFRLTLNKLMNRLIDHSYQYNMVANQLSLIKDECTLAASCNQNEKESRDDRRDSKTVEPPESKQANSFLQIGSQMRTSDISMMVRLISNELSQMLHQSRLQGYYNEPLDQATIIETGRIFNETRSYMTKKLNEIDSVVKQSALFLSRLDSKLPQFISIEKPAGQNHREITITYNNSIGSELKTALEPVVTIEASQTTVEPSPNSRPKSTRWFPGSKIPARRSGQPNVVELNRHDQSLSVRQSSEQVKSRCQSKTNLTFPSSCEQLRIHGANCTGQYYVFVRGEIRHVYCEMNTNSEEAWTVILRRLDKSFKDLSSDPTSEDITTNNSKILDNQAIRGSNQLLEALKASQLNFNLDWLKYKNGFGQMNDWAEFFIGLDLLHQLTNDHSNQTVTELQIDLETNKSNELHLKFDKFHISSEESQYKVLIGACNESSACESMIGINGSRFYTFDRHETGTKLSGSTNCSDRESGNDDSDVQAPTWGWWLPNWFFNSDIDSCKAARDFVSLTKPIGKRQRKNSLETQPKASELMPISSHIYWPNWRHSSEPLKRVVMKVRRKRLAGVSAPV